MIAKNANAAGEQQQNSNKMAMHILALVALMQFSVAREGLAWDSQEVIGYWSPVSGTLKTEDRDYSFYTMLGAAMLYRYSFAPRFALEVGYEFNSTGSTIMLHGPELGFVYTIYGRRSFRVAEEPLALEVRYPFDVQIIGGSWIRQADFTGLLPAQSLGFDDVAALASKGSLIGAQVGFGGHLELSTDLRLLLRIRYHKGFIAEIKGGAVSVWSAGIGVAYGLKVFSGF